MPRRMLINAQNPEELRVAILDKDKLDGYQVAMAESDLLRGNIYRGVVANMNYALNAAFVDFGAERHGFLAFHDVLPQGAEGKTVAHSRTHRIDEIIERGRSLLVQVVKEGIESKGAALTTNISLVGRYLILTPFDETRGVSRKVEDEESRRELRDRIADLAVPPGCGVIVRTAAFGQNKVALNRDLAALLRLWKRIRQEASVGKGSLLLYSDQDLIVQALRDHLDATSVAEVIVDADDAYQKASEYMRAFMPRARTRLIKYVDKMPLFSRYEVEPQIEGILRRRVELPGGASMVIDRTEALTAIDVNSGRASSGGSSEDTLFQVNQDAAREVARQLRLRDIGGLVVVDFIDMRSLRNQREVEKTLREAMKADKARFTVGRISPNGLLEINRQRIKQALDVRTRRPCPTCGGVGSLTSPDLVGLRMLRRIQTEAALGRLAKVRIELHPELADSLQNERRHQIATLEQEFAIRVEIVAASGLHRSEEKVEFSYHEHGDVKPITEPAAALQAGKAKAAGKNRRKPKTVKSQPPAVEITKVVAETEEGIGEAQDGKSADGRRRRRRGGRRHKKSAAPSVEIVPSVLASSGEVETDGPVQKPPVVSEKPIEKSQDSEATTDSPTVTKSRRRKWHNRRRRDSITKPNLSVGNGEDS